MIRAKEGERQEAKRKAAQALEDKREHELRTGHFTLR